MDYSEYQHNIAKFLQFFGLVLTGVTALGDNRLKRLEARLRRFRRLLTLNLIRVKTKRFAGMLFALIFSIAIIFLYPIMIFSDVSSTPMNLGWSGALLFIPSYLMSVAGTGGIMFIIINSVVKLEQLDAWQAGIVNYVNKKWASSYWWEVIKNSPVYKILYYVIIPPVYSTALLPIQTIQSVRKGVSVKSSMKEAQENYNRCFSQARGEYAKLLWRWGTFNMLRPVFILVILPVWLFYNYWYYAILLIIWFYYCYWFYVGYFIFTPVLAVFFAVEYVLVWLSINMFAVLISSLLYLFFLPYRTFELLRIKAGLRGSLFVAGILISGIGILID